MKLIRNQGLRWPDIQWVLDALGVVAEEQGASLALCGTIMEVRLPDLQALRQTSTTIKVIEEFQKKSSDGTNALSCIVLTDILAVILGCVL